MTSNTPNFSAMSKADRVAWVLAHRSDDALLSEYIAWLSDQPARYVVGPGEPMPPELEAELRDRHRATDAQG